MSTIPSTGNALTAATGAPQARQAQLGQADFMRLMTEQMKHQDPLKPMESTEFLAQLAQFSTVQGIDQMNQAMSAMASVMESDQTLRAASLVGTTAYVQADMFTTSGGQPVVGEVVAERAGVLQVDILDANGERVARRTVQAGAPGAVAWQWDGRDDAGNAVPAGSYSVRAVSDAGEHAAALPVRLSARVDSVSIDANGLTLNLDGLGGYPLGAIRRIG